MVLKMKRTTWKFTLLELLIVIAIIAILASLLFPSLLAVKEKSNSISCINNQKQIFNAFTLYQNDYSDYYIPYYADYAWTWLLSNNSYVNGKVFICPSGMKRIDSGWARNIVILWQTAERQETLSASISKPYYYSFFGYNYHYLGGSGFAPYRPIKTNKVTKPSSTIQAGDSVDMANKAVNRYIGNYNLHPIYNTSIGAPSPVHGKSDVTNIMWCDGHISSVKTNRADPYSADPFLDGYSSSSKMNRWRY